MFWVLKIFAALLPFSLLWSSCITIPPQTVETSPPEEQYHRLIENLRQKDPSLSEAGARSKVLNHVINSLLGNLKIDIDLGVVNRKSRKMFKEQLPFILFVLRESVAQSAQYSAIENIHIRYSLVLTLALKYGEQFNAGQRIPIEADQEVRRLYGEGLSFAGGKDPNILVPLVMAGGGFFNKTGRRSQGKNILLSVLDFLPQNKPFHSMLLLYSELGSTYDRMGNPLMAKHFFDRYVETAYELFKDKRVGEENPRYPEYLSEEKWKLAYLGYKKIFAAAVNWQDPKALNLYWEKSKRFLEHLYVFPRKRRYLEYLNMSGSMAFAGDPERATQLYEGAKIMWRNDHPSPLEHYPIEFDCTKMTLETMRGNSQEAFPFYKRCEKRISFYTKSS